MIKLTKIQTKVMAALFDGDQNEDDVLDNCSVSRRVFDTWLTEDAWICEFDRRIEQSKRQAQIIITKFQTTAALKLVELTGCDKEATARQACLDVIQMPRIASEPDVAKHTPQLPISEPTQNAIIELMANDAKAARAKKP